jgi:hypothetical protein
VPPHAAEAIQTLRKNLAAACGEVARLSVLLDKLKKADREQKSKLRTLSCQCVALVWVVLSSCPP